MSNVATNGSGKSKGRGRRARRGAWGAIVAVALALGLVVAPVAGGDSAGAVSLGGTISGTVTMPGGGPAVDGDVVVYDKHGYVDSVYVASGSYSFTDLPAGTYYLRYDYFDFAAYEWYNNATNLASATGVVVTSGATATANVQLAAASTIQGTVSMVGGGIANDGWVTVIDAQGYWLDYWWTDGAGAYSVPNLPAGSYYLYFSGFSGAVSEFNNNASGLQSATLVTVGAGATVTVNAALAASGTIAGNVTVGGSTPGEGGYVTAYDTGSGYAGDSAVDASGDYAITDLAPGDYSLWFQGGGVSSGVAETDDGPVTVTSGATTTVDADLALGGTISGDVTLDGGGYVGFGIVYASGVGGSYQGFVSEGDTAYLIEGVAPGAYTVSIEYSEYGAPEYYHDATAETAATVTVTGGANTTVNEGLVPVYGSGIWSISGTVTVPAGMLLADVTPVLYDTGGWDIDYATPAPDGTFTFDNPHPDGPYTVCFTAPYAIDDCVDVLIDGANVTGVDSSLASWQWIRATGTMHYAVASSMCLKLESATGGNISYVGCADTTTGTAVDRAFLVPAGSYYVSAYESNFGDIFWYGDSPTAELWWNNTGASRLLRSNATLYTTLASPTGTPATAFNFSSLPWLGWGASDLTVTSPLAPVVPGQAVSLSTHWVGAHGTPTGIVEYRDGAGFVGNANLAGGTATVPYVVPDPSVGYGFVDARYQGDMTYSGQEYWMRVNYLPVVESVSPGYGPLAGGTTVTVTGTSLGGATSVTFDGVEGTDITWLSDEMLTVVTPAGTDPSADVVVTTATGSSPEASAAFFAYLDGSVSAGIPTRIVDYSGFTAGVVRCFPVVGLAGVPEGATSVILNVTTASPGGGGYVVVYPDHLNNGASPAPLSSTVNFELGRDVANSATVALPSNGDVCAYSQGGRLGRLILDVAGYTVPGSGITVQNPVRLLDTRAATHVGEVTGPVLPATVYTIQVSGNAGVPAGATAVVANVTVTNVTTGGHLRMWEAGVAVPNTSVVNYAPAQTKANGQIIALNADGELSFESFGSSAQVIIDITGFVEDPSDFVATAPTRIVETRAAYGAVGIMSALVPNTPYAVLLDEGLVPLGATAVVMNVTAVNPTAFGNLRVYPDTNGLGTTPPPLASNLNYIPFRAIPNMVIVQIPADRKIDFYNNQASGSSRTDLIVDVIGYIGGPGPL